MTKAQFITLEGSEGVGKTTNLEYIESLLRDKAIDYVVTREPGGTDLGEQLRELLLGHQHTGMADDTELLMMFAARAEHLDKVIKPALARGQWVLCDRFTDATYAYQGGGRGIDPLRIKILEDYVQGDCRPDLTLLLDAPIEIGRERAGKRSAPDRFEKEQAAFFNKVRAAYLQRASDDSKRIKVIDASLELDAVKLQIDHQMQSFFNHLNSN
ncbi:MAG: dTMP kinase [Gammaproteobacteria bacterium]|nr:dTMP kinase [Gammaproteobacteria bacterium]